MSGGPFERFLQAQGFAVLDGGLATALEEAGHVLDSQLWSAQVLLDEPTEVLAVHRAYLQAGADCITTAGYQASLEGYAAAGLDRTAAEGALRRTVALAVEARDAFWAVPTNRVGRLEPLVAASAGPYGAFLADGSEYHGRYGVGAEALADFHGARMKLLAETPADVLAFETVPCLEEAEVLGDLLSAGCAKPTWISFTCQDGARLRDGTRIEKAVASCAGADPLIAVGVNCTHPGYVAELIERITSVTELTVLVYPNSGETYDPERGAWRGASERWSQEALRWTAAGARIVGGCCRVGPDDIRELRNRLEEDHALRGEHGEGVPRGTAG